MFVIEANRSQRGAIEGAIRRLSAARAHLIGAVLVKFDISKADFGSSYLLDYYGYGETANDAGAAAEGQADPKAA